MRHGRFATFDRSSYSILPRLDPIGGQRRLDPYAPAPVMAYLGGRPVYLARPDPRVRSSRGRALTVPLTISRMRREHDLQRGYAVDRPFVASDIDDVPLGSVSFSGRDQMLLLSGMLVGFGLGLSVAIYGPWRRA